MKKNTFLLLILCFVFLSSGRAQVKDISEIDEQLTERPWLDKSIHNLYGFTITKVFGERVSPQRHSNLGSITTMAYLNSEQLKEKYGKESPGGGIELFITRPTESKANLKWFFIVVRDENDNEKIMEIDLDYQAAQLPEANGWWNFTTVLFPESLEFPFYVYVNDKQSQHLSDYKFMVNKE